MRLIDADALIREICRDQCERKYEDCDGMCQMVAYVENTPTIGGWISVEDTEGGEQNGQLQRFDGDEVRATDCPRNCRKR